MIVFSSSIKLLIVCLLNKFLNAEGKSAVNFVYVFLKYNLIKIKE